MLFKKKRKGEEKMSTLEEVRKAYEDLKDEDKEAFKQSISDRVHESIAAQEEDEGEKDSQTAEDREHEALGEEHADERKEEEKEDAPEDLEEHEDKEEGALGEILERLNHIEEQLSAMKSGDGKKVREVERDDEKDLEKIASIYTN